AAARARHQQQHVGAVGDQCEADDDAAQLALHHEVGADAEEHRRGEREQHAHDDTSAATSRSVDVACGVVGGSGSSPKDSKTMSISPTTSTYTPTSNDSALVTLIVPMTGASNDRKLDSSTSRPNSSGAAAVHADSNRPVPSTVHGRKREWRRTSSKPPAMYHSEMAAPARSPPAKPPPG